MVLSYTTSITNLAYAPVELRQLCVLTFMVPFAVSIHSIRTVTLPPRLVYH